MGKIKFKSVTVILAFVLASFFIYSLVLALKLPKWFDFRDKDALNEWEEKVFKGRVLYSVVINKIGGYLSAYSKNAASGILYRLSFSPRKEPIVSWKWQVIKFPDKSKKSTSGGWIEKDDYAARFYIIFPSFPLFYNTKSLEYVWDRDLPEGTILTSPYFNNIKIIVAESGEKNLGKWAYEARNIYDDFKKSFGREPSRVGAIAIMTDTDNTISTAEANYDEIKIGGYR